MEEKENQNPSQDLEELVQLSENQGTDSSKREVIEISTKTSIFRYFLGAMAIFGACFISFLFIFQVVFTKIDVIGISMQPTINAQTTSNEDTIHIDSVFCFKTDNLKYKDIVIIKSQELNENIIKRVIALPGQTITFVKTNMSVTRMEYEVQVNGVTLSENYISQETPIIYPRDDYSYFAQIYSSLAAHGTWSDTMEADEYFVMGDNRNHSTDSRYLGPIKKSTIRGKVVLQIKYGQTLLGAILSAIF